MLFRIKCLFTLVSFQLTFSLLLFIIFVVFFFKMSLQWTSWLHWIEIFLGPLKLKFNDKMLV